MVLIEVRGLMCAVHVLSQSHVAQHRGQVHCLPSGPSSMNSGQTFPLLLSLLLAFSEENEGKRMAIEEK